MKTLCCYVVLTAVLLASLGCGVEQADQAPKKPEEQPVKEAIEEAPRGQPGEPGKQIQDAPKDSQLTPQEECQLNEAVADLGEAGTQDLVRTWVLSGIKPDSPDANFPEMVEDMGQAQNLSSFLAESGYTC